MVLLVAQRLNGGRVERLHAAAQRQVDTELTHNGLTGTSRRGNEDGAVRLHSGTRLTLKIIQRKIKGRLKSPEGGLRVCGSVVGALRRGLCVRSVRSVCVRSVLCVVLAHSMSSVTVHPPRAFRKHPARALIRYGRTASASAACERGAVFRGDVPAGAVKIRLCASGRCCGTCERGRVQVLCTPPLSVRLLKASYSI